METSLKKAIRTICMMTMAEAAAKIGVTPQTMTNWNTGKTPINSSAIKKLKRLGVPINVLCDPTKEV